MHIEKLDKVRRLITNTLDLVEAYEGEVHIHFHATEEDLKKRCAALILVADLATNSVRVASSTTLPTRNWAPVASAIERGLSFLHRSGMKDGR